MDYREQDIQKLCQAVKEHFATWNDNRQGPDTYDCRFCDKKVDDSKGPMAIVHSPDCVVLIARDLSTKMEV